MVAATPTRRGHADPFPSDPSNYDKENPMSHLRTPIATAAVLVALLATTGCVTEKKMRTTVDTEVGAVHQRVDDVEGQVEANQSRIADNERNIGTASRTAEEALQRAIEAGKLAEGKFLYETVLSDDKVRFGFDSAALGDEAASALDEFASGLKSQNADVFVEIQGHTDTIGSEDYNYELGLERAEAVRRHLNMRHGLPLHRMSVISYGEAAPVNPNKTREERAQNRRVVLVVLR
jgi:outer membrane protein OmpA-like peptidoglycan-associated protein